MRQWESYKLVVLGDCSVPVHYVMDGFVIVQSKEYFIVAACAPGNKRRIYHANL